MRGGYNQTVSLEGGRATKDSKQDEGEKYVLFGKKS